MRRKDNRGASFVMVIVAMAIVAILAVTILWIALANLQMKTTDEKNTDNFYSAEGVLDQICTGLEGDMSAAYTEGYSKVMQSYKTKGNADINEANRQASFVNTYVAALRSRLVDPGDAKGLTYSMDKIKGYVDSRLSKTDSSGKPVYPHAEVTSVSAPQLKTYQNRTVLEGIKVEFTDEKGYKSVIQTDISLAVPTMSFTASGGVPELFTYSLVGNTGLEIGTGAHNVNLGGNLYAGSDSTGMCVLIPDNTKLRVDNASYMIADGNLEVGNPNSNRAGTHNESTLSIDKQCQLWTKNINVNGANVSLEGTTYVSDDMTLKGSGSTVTLGKDKNGKSTDGKYVGFGNSDNSSAESSAIIINGRESTLDMSGIKELMLAGNAYINRSSMVKVNGSDKENKDVAMGESISVKGNQIAYRIPPECIGTDGDDAAAKSVYYKNPLSYSEDAEITSKGNDNQQYTVININVVSSKTGKPLSYYLSQYLSADQMKNTDNYIRKVYAPSNGSENDGLVYYYLNMPVKQASQYYEDYYNIDHSSADSKLQKYTAFYTKSIQVNDAASIYTSGDYSLYDGSNLSLLKGIVDGVDMDAQSIGLNNTYTALRKRLITSYNSLPPTAETASLFTNIVHEDNLKKFTEHETGKKLEVTTNYTDKYNKDETYKAVVVDGDYTYPQSDSKENKNVRIIVATGNVTINADFTGTIIAGKKIFVNKQCTVLNCPQEIFKALLLKEIKTGSQTMHLYDVFDDGADYLGGITKTTENGSGDADIDYSSLITYQNWKKK